MVDLFIVHDNNNFFSKGVFMKSHSNYLQNFPVIYFLTLNSNTFGVKEEYLVRNSNR